MLGSTPFGSLARRARLVARSHRTTLVVAAPLLIAAPLLAAAPQIAVAGNDGSLPAFVQQVSAHKLNVTSLPATPTTALTSGNRLVVEVGVWSAGKATAKSLTDTAGDTFTELIHFVAADGTEQSIWTAPITTSAGTKPVVTATATAKADIGLVVLEYSGLSTANDASAMDVSSHAVGTTGGTPATVSSGGTGPVVTDGELAIAFYADSGFKQSLTSGDMFNKRAVVAPVTDMEMLVEDKILMGNDNPDGPVGTGANTTWLMSTVVFRKGGNVAPTAPQSPAGVTGLAGDGMVTVTWNAPSSGGSPVTSYTVTPYANGTAQAPVQVTGSPLPTKATISGLTNGTPYTFTVTATNAIGTSAPSAPSMPATPGQSSAGQWTSLATSPIVAVHSMQLPNGTFMQFDGWQQPQPTYVFDPATNSYTEVDAPDSIFCAGNAFLPDGRVITIGGYGSLKGGNLGIKDTSIFDPATSTWTRVADMNLDRWYPTLTELPDGRYVAISGNSVDAGTWAETPEVYDPATNKWTLLSKVNTSQVHEEEYPFSYVVPSGKVFVIGPSEDLSFLLDVNAQSWTSVGGASGVINGSSVMYRPGKILYSGGAPTVLSTSNSTNSTSVIDLTSVNPAWRKTAPMANNRVYHTLTMMADGRVLAVGGEATSDQTVVKTGVLATEIWDPNTETWSAGAPIAASRNYHSTAALLPDGRIIISGGGHPNAVTDPGQYSTQIYSPSYLFNGPRPTVTSATDAVTYGQSITINTPDADSIGSVNLVSLAADTHQIDMNQRFVPLSFTSGSGTITATAPGTSALAPPGNYMVYILNKKGVPAVATNIKILATAPTAPSAPTGVTASAGTSSATIKWTVPASNGGPSITSYTVTPYVAGVAQTPTTVTGAPPATSTTIRGLTNGTSYTFVVSANNSAGTSADSTPSSPVTPVANAAPVFIQQLTTHQANVTSISLTPNAAVTSGNRLIVAAGVYADKPATATAVTDSAGDVFTEVSHFVASDGTEQSVWTAPIGTGGTKPVITVKTSGTAEIGVSAMEYAGLSTAAGAAAVDTQAHAIGQTGSAAATVQSGATAATTAPNELALGIYTDSGYSNTPTAGTGFTSRAVLAPTQDIELLVEDQVVAVGAQPNAGAKTGKAIPWLMNTVVFKGA